MRGCTGCIISHYCFVLFSIQAFSSGFTYQSTSLMVLTLNPLFPLFAQLHCADKRFGIDLCVYSFMDKAYGSSHLAILFQQLQILLTVLILFYDQLRGHMLVDDLVFY